MDTLLSKLLEFYFSHPMSFLTRSFFFFKNTRGPDYIIRTPSRILFPDLFVDFGTWSTLMDDDASYE